MNRRFLLLAISFALLMPCSSLAQSTDLPKFEIAGEFSTLDRQGFGERRTEPGVGARFTFNFNRSLAFETAGYFFPHQCSLCQNAGNISQVVGGVKVGKRFEKWGIFAKARPGVVSFSRGEFNPIIVGGGVVPFEVEINRITSFATDFGGVLEFYPSPRIVTRFDAGDTMIHFRRRTINALLFNPFTQEVTLIPINRPARTTHNFQFIAGVGFRF
jgi:hypothetical protein